LQLATISISAMGVVRVMRDQLYREEGLPSKVYSDWGLQFISTFMKDLYSLLRIKGIHSIPSSD
jgi:hypothetical protein